MKGLPYKNTFAAKGSALYEALEAGDTQKAKAIYDATTERMNQLTKPKEKDNEIHSQVQ